MIGLDTPDAAGVEAVERTALLLSRLLLQNGTDTAQVETSMETVAAAFGCEAHLMMHSFPELTLGGVLVALTFLPRGHRRRLCSGVGNLPPYGNSTLPVRIRSRIVNRCT
jgi:hypothetical protein